MTKPDTEWKSCEGQSQIKAKDQKSQSQSQLNKLTVKTKAAARSSNPTGGYEDEGIRRFEDYHGDGNKDGSTAAKEKGRVEHFGITLRQDEEGIMCDATATQD
ncbi:hypothetical protein Tco_1392032 [Tanacetum coccineum]